MNVRFLRSVGDVRQLPRDGLPEVAFAGRSNVGKSSLINSLLQRRRLAQISSTPGKTRTINYYRLDDRLYFVDLPGYGFAKVPEEVRRQWRRLIEGYFASSQQLRGVVVIVDARHAPTRLDIQMAEWLRSLSLPYVIAATKADKLASGHLERQVREHKRVFSDLGAQNIFPYSAVDGRGKKDLWRVITAWTGYRPG